MSRNRSGEPVDRTRNPIIAVIRLIFPASRGGNGLFPDNSLLDRVRLAAHNYPHRERRGVNLVCLLFGHIREDSFVLYRKDGRRGSVKVCADCGKLMTGGKS